MALTKQGLKKLLIPGLSDDLAKIYNPISSFTLGTKSEQAWKTISQLFKTATLRLVKERIC
jgi:hypothetical protein